MKDEYDGMETPYINFDSWVKKRVLELDESTLTLEEALCFVRQAKRVSNQTRPHKLREVEVMTKCYEDVIKEAEEKGKQVKLTDEERKGGHEMMMEGEELRDCDYW